MEMAAIKKMSNRITRGLLREEEDKIIDHSPLPEPPAPAPLDPRLPLTAKQKFNIIKSWKGIAREMELTGVNMFVRLFEEHEDLLKLFSKFRTLKTKQERITNNELRQHATIVMTTLDEALRALDDVDYLLEYLEYVGKLHSRMPGFNKEFFWNIQNPFLEAVQQTLGDRYTDNMDTIYRITIKFIIEKLIEGFNSASMKTNSKYCFANRPKPTRSNSTGSDEINMRLPSKLQELQIADSPKLDPKFEGKK